MKYLKYGFYLFLPILLGSLVGIITSNSIDYTTLVLPRLSPPGYLFPIVWSILYLLMGISYYIYKKEYEDTTIVDVVYYIQLSFNLLWTIVFFTLKLRLLACFWIVILDMLVIFLLYLFYNRKRISAFLNTPYLLWILFATYLTLGIYILN